MIKCYTESHNFNIYFHLANELGFEIDLQDLANFFARFSRDGRSWFIYRNEITTDNYLVRRISLNKFLSYVILNQTAARSLIPPHELIRDGEGLKRLELFYQLYNGEIVLKPLMGSSARGVLVNPDSLDLALAHAEELFSTYPNDSGIIAEKMSRATNEYRVIVWQGKVVDIIRRVRASVTGDGHSSIAQLVNKKNQMRQQAGLTKDIYIDDGALATAGVTLDSVPVAGQTVYLNKVSNLGKGGDVYPVKLDELHPSYLKVFSSVYDYFGANLLGYDVMTDDLSTEPTAANTIINEINTAPMPEVSYFARIDEQDPLSHVRELFKLITTS